MALKFKQIQSILNSEGDILSLLTNDSDELFIMARTNEGKSQIICRTNRFRIELYLNSRITLLELYLLSESEHFLIKTGKTTTAKFFESTPGNIPTDITGIQYGNELFHLLPKSVRTEKPTNEILEKLPIEEGVKLVVDRDISISQSQVQFFSEDSPIKVVQVESEIYNPTEFDYLSVPLYHGKGNLLCRLSPQLLKLYFTNRITTIELFESQSDKEYFYTNKQGKYKLFYTDGLAGFISKLSYGDLTYYSLPSDYLIENSIIEVWDYYTRNIVISGHGVFPVNFEREYDVEIKIR